MLGAALLVLALIAGACSSSKKSDAGTTTDSGSGSTTATTAAAGGASFDQAAFAKVSGTLKGSGSTFQQPFDNGAIENLKQVIPGLTITYGGGGSGQGKTDLQNGTVDFAGTDSLVKPEDKAKYKGEFLYFPTVAAPITVSYNLSVKDLKLDGPTVAKIYTGKVTSWNDPAIAALNAGVSLPADPITVCARAEASGTTSNFTKFLKSAAPTDFTADATDQPTVWTLGTIQKSQGNGGVAACVKGKAGAVGYVDFSDAKKQGLTFAQIKNKKGEFVAASLEGATKAVEGAQIAPDLTYNPIDVDAAGAYPVTSPTWVLVYAKQPDAAKAKALQAWLSFLETDAQQFAASQNYAALPATLTKQALAQVDKVQ
jgi:phosphate transport system substrate-binding protein